MRLSRFSRQVLVCAAAALWLPLAAPRLMAQARTQPPLGSIAPAQPAAPERETALQAEADRLARESRTLLGELRKLEVERDLQNERAARAERAVAEATRVLTRTTARLNQLEQQRVSELPDVSRRLVDLYKRGRTGNARLLLGASNVREFARTTRAVASMSTVTRSRLESHAALVAQARAERASQANTLRQLQRERQQAEAGRTAANSAVAARAALLSDIDRRRDLTAQMAGEIQAATRKLDEQITSVATAPSPAAAPATAPAPAAPPAQAPATPDAAATPPAGGATPPARLPVRGGVAWPLSGRVVGRFGEPATRFGATTVRNGIEIEADEGTPVTAVRDGAVIYAQPFTGFGTLVILDHGRGYHTVYGYLSSASVSPGDRVEVGREVGRVGAAPGGSSTLYFEFRLDGRSVDPLQWLRPQ